MSPASESIRTRRRCRGGAAACPGPARAAAARSGRASGPARIVTRRAAAEPTTRGHACAGMTGARRYRVRSVLFNALRAQGSRGRLVSLSRIQWLVFDVEDVGLRGRGLRPFICFPSCPGLPPSLGPPKKSPARIALAIY